jgi:tRNA1Val (adenine37-N6)-methyltransferase
LQTRHTIFLDYKTLISAVLRLLDANGKFNVILPCAEGLQFIDLAAQSSLCCSRKYSFRTRPGKPIERWLLEFSKRELSVDEGEIILYEKGLVWSAAYVSLTRTFYLKL